MRSSFGDILASKAILVCVGSGGVGKTTTAAAIALESARRGRRTLVLTIDPAKRLANSLGLEQLGHAVQQVAPQLVGANGAVQAGGELWAMMLDQKQAFDEIVGRYASDPDAVARILANPVYAQISRSLAGAQEYAALAKLHEFDAEGAWDLIVVDTPPTAHALDFLDAPQKLTHAIDSPAIEWFRKIRHATGRRRWSVAGRTGAYVLKRIAKFVGSQFLDDLAIFFTEFNDILGGFRHRAEAVFDLLRQPRVGFVLVCSPEPMAVDEAVYFHARLTESHMPFAAFIVNKVHPDDGAAPSARDVRARLAACEEIVALGLDDRLLTKVSETLVTSSQSIQQLARADRASIERLRSVGGSVAILRTIPYFRGDVHDLASLTHVAERIFAA